MKHDIDDIFELVRDEVKPVIEPLVDDGKKWREYGLKYRKEMDKCSLTGAGLKRYTTLHRLYKESESQYVSIVKVLLSAIRRDAVGEKDEFEEYLKANKGNII